MVLSWIILLVVLVVGFLLLEAKDIKHRLLLFVVLGAIFFVAGSLGYVMFDSDIPLMDFVTFDGLVYFGQLYIDWLVLFVQNMGSLTGYVANQDWSVNNSIEGILGK